MQVFKARKPITAFEFVASSGGSNYKELAAEVEKLGGFVEHVDDVLVYIHFNARKYALPINYVLVFDGGSRVISKRQFDEEYVSMKDDAADLSDLSARLEAVEAELSKLTKPKAKAKKSSDDATDTNGTSEDVTGTSSTSGSETK